MNVTSDSKETVCSLALRTSCSGTQAMASFGMRCTDALLLLGLFVAGAAAAPKTCLTEAPGGGTMSVEIADAKFCVRYCFKCTPGPDTGCTDAEKNAGTVKLVYTAVADQATVDYLKAASHESKVFSCDTSDCNTAKPDFCTSSTVAGTGARTEAALFVTLAFALAACVRTVLH